MNEEFSVEMALKALAEPRRQEILHLIGSAQGVDGVSCCNILGSLDIAQSTLSHHMTELEAAGLISCVKQGRVNLLSVNRDRLALVAKYIQDLVP